MPRIKVGVLGGTGMVGQRFISLLEGHPWFEVTAIAASPRSAGKKYEEAVAGRWYMEEGIPEFAKDITVQSVEHDRASIAKEVELVFSALDMDKAQIVEIENQYAKDIAVVSNNSAHRWTADVPMIMPEINPEHTELIDIQRKRRSWSGFIAVKPNCSIQSYVPAIHALRDFTPKKLAITTFQAISGAGKTFESWPEMVDNVIPLIKGEEEKSEKEPLKVWGSLMNGSLEFATLPEISATCIRVPVTDGHLASVCAKFERKPSREEVIDSWRNFRNPIAGLNLPSAPKPFLHYFEEDDRPQTKLDRNAGHGMGVTIGRLREDRLFDWKFVSLSHNTVRGAAGGAILVAELIKAKHYF